MKVFGTSLDHAYLLYVLGLLATDQRADMKAGVWGICKGENGGKVNASVDAERVVVRGIAVSRCLGALKDNLESVLTRRDLAEVRYEGLCVYE